MKQKMNEANNEILDELPVNDMSYDLIDLLYDMFKRDYQSVCRGFYYYTTCIVYYYNFIVNCIQDTMLQMTHKTPEHLFVTLYPLVIL